MCDLRTRASDGVLMLLVTILMTLMLVLLAMMMMMMLTMSREAGDSTQRVE
jgi:flagellar basal body-associated protein FliL